MNRRNLMCGALALPALALLKPTQEEERARARPDHTLLKAGPPHWFWCATFEHKGTLYHLLDYWRWDGESGRHQSQNARFWVVRVDSRATAEMLASRFQDCGVDQLWAAREYRPSEMMSDMAKRPLVVSGTKGWWVEDPR